MKESERDNTLPVVDVSVGSGDVSSSLEPVSGSAPMSGSAFVAAASMAAVSSSPAKALTPGSSEHELLFLLAFLSLVSFDAGGASALSVL